MAPLEQHLSYIYQENAFLARQAVEIAKKLPSDQVSSTEYYAIAFALTCSYKTDEAINFLQKAINTSHSLQDELVALRSYANLLFFTGQPEAGRVEYQKALNAFSRYKGYDDHFQKMQHIMTEFNWASSEANKGFKDLANQRITNAESLASSLPPMASVGQLKKLILDMKSSLNSGNSPTTRPCGIPCSFVADGYY